MHLPAGGKCPMADRRVGRGQNAAGAGSGLNAYPAVVTLSCVSRYNTKRLNGPAEEAIGIIGSVYLPSPLAIGAERHAALSERKKMSRRLTAVIHREGDGFVALCPELDIASQGDSVESARDNLREALELFFECASSAEVQERLGQDVFVTQVEVAGG